jgi:2-hydroxy-3-oxopropionate reductase
MATIGFIGPGIMGMPMAANLVRAGHEVRCFGRSKRSRDRAERTGAKVVDTISAACRGAEFAITMLPDSPDVLDVVEGPDGVLAALAAGSCLIDQSTISPAAALQVHAGAAERGIDCLDAPVSGGEAGAVEGALSIMVGGAAGTFERSLPVLRAMGSTVIHVGPAGSGQVVKAANQLMVAGHLQMLSEAMVFLRAHEVDLDSALDVIGAGLAGSTVLDRKRTAMVLADFAPGFRVALHDKDLSIVMAAAREHGLSLAVTAVVASMMAALKTRGGAELDHSALLQLACDLNGQIPGRPA